MPDLETSLSYCTFCPKLCRHVCPVSNAEARETVIPQAKMARLAELRRRPDEANREAASALYACTGCLACTTACHHGITPGKHLLDARADLERDGLGHPALVDLTDRVRAKSTEAARTARESVAAERVRAEAQVAFLPGCEAPDAAARALQLFDRIGAEYVALADVSQGCGGYPLLAGGFPEAFRMHAEALARELQGYSKVVVACPACAWAMQREYPARGVVMRPEVLHTVEFLEQFVERLPIAHPPATDGVDTRREAFYHDPCYLGRWKGVYDAPRRLLSKAMRVREFSRNRAEAECSGGGGVLPETMPDTARAIAAHRVEEVREAGLDTVVTACPTCRRQLGETGIHAIDIVDVLEEATR